jgi:hypothetical protein
MNRSYSKKRHIQESNRILENRLFGRRLMEYDVDDEAMTGTSLEQELGDVASEVSEYVPNLDVTSADKAVEALNSSEVCQIGDDTESFVIRKFKDKITQYLPKDLDPLEVLKQMGQSINNFIDYISKLEKGDLKNLLKELKSKIKEAKNKVETPSTVSEGRLLREFFGTTMAIVEIGSFQMPALFLTIGSYIIVGFLTLWLIGKILCSFNIKITKIKKCRVRSFEWGQCQSR